MREKPQSVLVTGAGSGMGLECALLLAARGYRVSGTVLTDGEGATLAAEAANRNVEVHVMPLDVTNFQQIESLVPDVIDELDGLDSLVHFAGLGLRGFFEDLSLDEIRRVYDVNVFGAMKLTQCVLPHMRARRKGRIVITSSAAGRMGSMSISGYSSSKFALEGFAECLSQEVYPFNIFVSLLEPGLVRTPHFSVNRNRARRAVLPASPYYRWFCQHEHIVDKLLARNGATARDVAETVFRILDSRRPKLRYVVGAKAKIVFALRRHIPGEWFERWYWAAVRRAVTAPRVQANGLSGTPTSDGP